MTARQEPPSPLVQRWCEWLEQPCSIKRHARHLRHDCAESREQAVRALVVLDDPDDIG